MRNEKPVVLCIMDGWGLRQDKADNAVALAHTPNFDRLLTDCPTTQLSASGPDVGLPQGQMGNSEVGHTNIGAGRVVRMDLPKIDAAILSGNFQKMPNLQAFVSTMRASKGAVHIFGLMSEGGVHAHLRHLVASVAAFADAGLPVRLHLFLDGRDTPPKSALGDLEKLQSAIDALSDVSIATVTGRFFALDRDTRWDRIERAYRAIAFGDGVFMAKTAAAAITAAYQRGETDEFAQATIIGGYAGLGDGDGIFMTHFRADRAREILSAFLEPAFTGFDRGATPTIAAALGMVAYSEPLNRLMNAIFPQEVPQDSLGEWVSAQGKKQFRVAETEKYPHVTFFFNGGVESPWPGEERFMVASPKVATYDQKPEMSAAEVTEALTSAILSREYALIVVNFANPDMVGHTGDLQAAIKAVEAVDASLGRAMTAVKEAGGAMLITADHGNCELMRDPATAEPHTAHTTNPVPLVLFESSPRAHVTLADGGRLSDLAPTTLALMGIDQPAAMIGRSLLEKTS